MKTLNIILHSLLQISLAFVALPQAMAQEMKEPLRGEPGYGFGFGLPQPTLTNTVTKDWQLTADLTPGNAIVKLGQPVVITLYLKNVSSNNLPCGYLCLTPWYDFKIVNAVGKELPLTSKAIKQIKNDDESQQPEEYITSFALQPGGALGEQFPITSYYKISTRGTYFITARRQLWLPSGEAGVIVANTVTLIVQ